MLGDLGPMIEKSRVTLPPPFKGSANKKEALSPHKLKRALSHRANLTLSVTLDIGCISVNR
jgi:hypothetical protein